jgi:hypothetical protein
LQSAVVEADFTAAEAHLAALEDSFTCGSVVGPALLGRIWLLEAALLTFTGDAEAAQSTWNAAARVAPSEWIDDLGDVLRVDYEAAPVADGRGHIEVQPPLFRGSIAAIDGAIISTPIEVQAGLHLVQAGTGDSAISYGKIIFVEAGSIAIVSTGLVAPANAAPPEPERARARLAYPFRAHLASGALVTLGSELRAPGISTEPATKFTMPVELGLHRDLEKAWYRLALSVSPLIGGRYLYANGSDINGSPVGIGGHFAGGWIRKPLGVGGSAGVSWPGRILTRVVLSTHLGDLPLSVEARAGLNIATERAPEPAAGIVAVFHPYL